MVFAASSGESVTAWTIAIRKAVCMLSNPSNGFSPSARKFNFPVPSNAVSLLTFLGRRIIEKAFSASFISSSEYDAMRPPIDIRAPFSIAALRRMAIAAFRAPCCCVCFSLSCWSSKRENWSFAAMRSGSSASISLARLSRMEIYSLSAWPPRLRASFSGPVSCRNVFSMPI